MVLYRRLFSAASTTAAPIVVVGAAVTDMITYVRRLPSPGETIHGSEFVTGFGGKGANQAVQAALLSNRPRTRGANHDARSFSGNGSIVIEPTTTARRVAFIGRVGSDSMGAETLANFDAVGVERKHVGEDSASSTGCAPITVDESGENSIIVVMAANDSLTAAHVEAARETIAASQLVVCQLEIPLRTTAAALRIAKEEGVQTLLNCAPAFPLATLRDAGILDHVDILAPNESETAVLLGSEAGDSDALLGSDDAASAAALRLLEEVPHCSTVVLTLGKRGAIVVERENGAIVRVPTGPEIPVDTVGAGDSFVGTLAHCLAVERMPMADAARHAALVASRSVAKRGTQTSFPSTLHAS